MLDSQTITLNVVPNGVPPIIDVTQNDTGRTIRLVLKSGSSTYNLLSSYTYVLCGTKPTGTGFSYDNAVSVVGTSTLSFNTNSVMTAVSGDVRCGIIIYDGDEHVETLNFILHVQRTALDADTIIDSSDFESIIVDAVSDYIGDGTVISEAIQEYIDDLGDRVDQLEDAVGLVSTDEIFDWESIGNSSYPTGWRNGRFDFSDGTSSTSSNYSRSRRELPLDDYENISYMELTAPENEAAWIIAFSDYPSYSNGADNSDIYAGTWLANAGETIRVIPEENFVYYVVTETNYADIATNAPVLVLATVDTRIDEINKSIAPIEETQTLMGLTYPLILETAPYRGQGGCLVDDTYLWCINATEDQDPTRITVRYVDLMTGNQWRSKPVDNGMTASTCGHCNDVTYCPDDGYLYLATTNATNTIAKLSNPKLCVYHSNIPAYDGNGNEIAICSVAYNRKTHEFIAVEEGWGGLYFYNSSWVYQRSVIFSQPSLTGLAAQGMDTDGDYIYIVADTTAYKAYVLTYDMEGTFVTQHEIVQISNHDPHMELEGIAFDWNHGYFIGNSNDKTANINRQYITAIMPNDMSYHTFGATALIIRRWMAGRPF